MKKYAILLAIFLISGCQNTDEPISVNTGQSNVSNVSTFSDDVVARLGEIENFERFEEFLVNTEKGVKDKLTIVQYTTEGIRYFRSSTTMGRLSNQQLTQVRINSVRGKSTRKRVPR